MHEVFFLALTMATIPKIDRRNIHLYVNELKYTWEKCAKYARKSVRTVQQWYQQFKNKKGASLSKPLGRPKSVLTQENLKRIKKYVENRKFHSVRRAASQLKNVGSKSTVHCALTVELGLSPVKRKKRVLLTEAQKQHRLIICEDHWINNMNVNTVAFSDEKRFSLFMGLKGTDFV